MSDVARSLERLEAALVRLRADRLTMVRFRLVAERRADGVRAPLPDAVGVLDYAGWRYALDHGGFAHVYNQGRFWDGASGERLTEFDPVTPWAPTPLTLLAFIEAATDATEIGTLKLGDDDCVHLAVTSDLDRLTEPMHRPLPMPAETLDPHDVHSDAFLTDQGRLRRLYWQSPYQPSSDWIAAVELDFNRKADSEAFDSSRAPTFQPDPDAETPVTPEQVAELNRIIEMIEGRGTPEPDA